MYDYDYSALKKKEGIAVICDNTDAPGREFFWVN